MKGWIVASASSRSADGRAVRMDALQDQKSYPGILSSSNPARSAMTSGLTRRPSATVVATRQRHDPLAASPLEEGGIGAGVTREQRAP